MANPQKENGYTSIANEIIEHLVILHLLGSEWDIIMFFLRKTYGYQKKEDWISLGQFQKATGLSRMTVVKCLKNLVVKGVLVKAPLLGYKFNKDWELWGGKAAFTSKHVFTTSGKAAFTDTGKAAFTYKRKKETITKENKETANAVSDINLIFDIFYKSINPTINYGNTTQRKAVQTLINKVGLEKAVNATKYAISIQVEKYAPVITTPIQLLNKYGELQAYYAKKNTKQTNQKKGLIL